MRKIDDKPELWRTNIINWVVVRVVGSKPEENAQAREYCGLREHKLPVLQRSFQSVRPRTRLPLAPFAQHFGALDSQGPGPGLGTGSSAQWSEGEIQQGERCTKWYLSPVLSCTLASGGTYCGPHDELPKSSGSSTPQQSAPACHENRSSGIGLPLPK